jgi:hypothetical protein
MKNSIKILVVVLCLISTTFSHAQSFQKHDMFIDLGFGLGIYNTTTYNYVNDSNKTGKTASVVIPLSFEYAIGNRIGIGLQLVTESFLSSKDSTKGNKPTAHAGSINLLGNYHFFRTDHTDLSAGLALGGSNFTYNQNNATDAMFTGGGTYFDLHFSGRFLFGKHFGMLVSLTFPTMTYNQGVVSDNIGDSFNLDLKLRGYIIGTGFTFKI